MTSIRCGLILAAAGLGSRLAGGRPKQFLRLQGQPLFLKALEPFLPIVDQVAVVVPASYLETTGDYLKKLGGDKKVFRTEGGATRQESVLAGFRRLDPDLDIILTHDAARPFASPRMIRLVVERALATGACIPVIPVNDTVKVVQNNRVCSTLDRETLRLAQTPQAFRRVVLEEAFEKALDEGFTGTDESALVEYAGLPVEVVEGEISNIKITHREDLALARQIR